MGTQEEKNESVLKLAVLFIAGLAGLIGGAHLAVDRAVAIAHTFGLSETFIGLTVVAPGTSIPDSVTCLVAAAKKRTSRLGTSWEAIVSTCCSLWQSAERSI